MHVVEYCRLSTTIANYFTAQCFAGKFRTILAVKLKHGGRRTCTAGACTSYNWFAAKEKVPVAEKSISKMRIWTREILQEGKSLGHYHPLVQQLRRHDRKYFFR